MRTRSRGESGERGVAMIELAIILTLLVLLIFGMIDFGNTFSNFQNLRQGVRESAREAANNPTQFGSSTAFYNFIVGRTGLSASQLTVTWTTSGTTGGGFWSGITSGTNVTVCVKFTNKSITGFAAPFLPSKLSSNVVMRFEPPSSTFPMPASPAATSGVSPCN